MRLAGLLTRANLADLPEWIHSVVHKSWFFIGTKKYQ